MAGGIARDLMANAIAQAQFIFTVEGGAAREVAK